MHVYEHVCCHSAYIYIRCDVVIVNGVVILSCLQGILFFCLVLINGNCTSHCIGFYFLFLFYINRSMYDVTLCRLSAWKIDINFKTNKKEYAALLIFSTCNCQICWWLVSGWTIVLISYWENMSTRERMRKRNITDNWNYNLQV